MLRRVVSETMHFPTPTPTPRIMINCSKKRAKAMKMEPKRGPNGAKTVPKESQMEPNGPKGSPKRPFAEKYGIYMHLGALRNSTKANLSDFMVILGAILGSKYSKNRITNLCENRCRKSIGHLCQHTLKSMPKSM